MFISKSKPYYLALPFLTLFFLIGLVSTAQTIKYSEGEKQDTRNMQFEIIGKVKTNLLIFKYQRNNGVICSYGNDMALIKRSKCDFLPDQKIINADFVNFGDGALMVYQYQKKSIVHSMLAKISDSGTIIGTPIELDTVKIGFFANNKIFNFVQSDDRNQLALFRVKKMNNREHSLVVIRFSKNGEILQKQRMFFAYADDSDDLSEFSLNNDGQFAFLKTTRSSWSSDYSKRIVVNQIGIDDNYILGKVITDYEGFTDDVRLKADNMNKRWVISAFYANERRGFIKGVLNVILNQNNLSLEAQQQIALSDQVRQDAKGDGGSKAAFDDYIIKNIQVKKDGGFLVTAESHYFQSRNLTGRMNDPVFFNSGFNQGFMFYDPFYNYYYTPQRNTGVNNMRYISENILISSYNSVGESEWNQVIVKSQYEDDNENMISHFGGVIGGELRFLFNKQDRSNWILNDHGLTPTGSYSRKPTYRNMDKGYELMPRLSKQISNKTIIMPCKYRNYICFAKIDY
jgi:hypothetical protein